MKFVNVLTAVIAVVLSIVFVVMSIATVITSSVVAFIEPKNIIKLVQSIDYNALLSKAADGYSEVTDELLSDGNNDTDSSAETELETDASVSVDNTIQDQSEETTPVGDSILTLEGIEGIDGKEGEFLNDIMQSNTVQDLVGEYAQGITSVITGEEVSEGLTADKLKNIADENMDEIVGIAKEYVGDEVSEEELRVQIEKVIDENAEDIVAAFPSVEDVKNEMEDETIKMLGEIFKPTLTYVMIGITVVIALLIYACRFKRFGGFMWIGVDCIVASAFVAIISAAVNLCESVIVEMLGIDATIVKSVLNILTGTINMGLIILVAAAVVCIAAYIILKKTVVKKKTLQQA